MIDDNETFVRAVEIAHDELGLTYAEIAASVGMSDSNLWAIRTQGRQQRATAGTKVLLDQFFATRGSSAVVVVGAFLRGEAMGRKWETRGFVDQTMVNEMEDDLRHIVQTELDDETIGGQYEPDLRVSVDRISPQDGPVERLADFAADFSISAFSSEGMDPIDS